MPKNTKKTAIQQIYSWLISCIYIVVHVCSLVNIIRIDADIMAYCSRYIVSLNFVKDIIYFPRVSFRTSRVRESSACS